jgi:cis-L-3-hydroxyproline dehydratase
MKLEPEQESILRGESGRAMARAMQTLVAYGEAFGAPRLVPIRSAHLTGSNGLMPFRAYYDVIDLLAAEGARVRVPTTINPRPGRNLSLANRVVFTKQNRLERTYSALGVTPNYSCVCYFDANVPSRGDSLGWAESSAVQYANSALGARTNRTSVLVDLCGAVTGLTPEFGYLLDENRRGRLLVKLDIQKMDVAALGFILGRKVVDRVPVIEHYPFTPVELKNMGGAMAASGAVALFHVEGVTPEAPDMKTVFDGEPEATITVTQKDLDALRTKRTQDAAMIAFGCPQMTFDEAAELVQMFAGKKITKKVVFCIIPEHKKRFDTSPHGEKARVAGVTVLDCCPLAAFTMGAEKKPVLTNSGKLYYYLPGSLYGTTGDCLRACGAG